MNFWAMSTFLWMMLLQTCVHILVWTSVFHSFGHTSRKWIVGHMIILCLNFWGTIKVFSTVADHFIFLPAIYKGSNFSISLPTLLFFFTYYRYPSECGNLIVVLICISVLEVFWCILRLIDTFFSCFWSTNKPIKEPLKAHSFLLVFLISSVSSWLLGLPSFCLHCTSVLIRLLYPSRPLEL